MAVLLRLPGVECGDLDVLLGALTLWSGGKLDFADAYVAALSRTFEGAGIVGFDRDFDRIEGVDPVDPARY